MQDPVYIRALEQASVLKGGDEALAGDLGVSVATVREWMRGLKPVPSEIFLKAVDVLYSEASRGGGGVNREPSRAP